MNFDIRPIVFINGIVICCFAGMMAIPLILDTLICTGAYTKIFLSAIIASLFLGGLMIFSCRLNKEVTFSKVEIFFLVVSIWCTTSVIGALPFYAYSNVNLPFTSALFESVSGITTTGCSVYKDVEILPRALNLWRFILHFVGGVGIVAIGIFMLPVMRIGGMQLFLAENSDKTQKILPRVSQIVGLFLAVYTGLILVFSILLKCAGMSLFDSICHSISAISTGGFSTKNFGLLGFNSIQINIIISIAMFIGGISFLEVVRSFKYGIKAFRNNSQVKAYIKILLFMIIAPLLIACIRNNINSLNDVFTHILQTISAMTTTGLVDSSKYFAPQIVLFLLAAIGGCSGSTAGGIKVFRLQILYAVLKTQINKILKPFDVNVPKYQNKKIDDTLLMSLVAFLFSLIVVFIGSVALVEFFSNKTMADSVFAVTSCLFNLGYEFNVSEFGVFAKTVFLFDMIIGRLELIPFFVVLIKLKNLFK